MFPKLMSTPVTGKENEITKIVSDPAFPEASTHAKKKKKVLQDPQVNFHQWAILYCLQTKNGFHIFYDYILSGYINIYIKSSI